VKSLTILVPPPAITAAFEAAVGPLVTRVLASCNESCTLATLRDELLPKLISGELRVSEAERVVAEAAA
jgi:type I restriction enzyme, S subunit